MSVYMYVVILSVARKKRLSDLRTCSIEVVDLEKPKRLLKSRMFKVDRNITIIIRQRRTTIDFRSVFTADSQH